MNYPINITSWDYWEKRDSVYAKQCIEVAGIYGMGYFETTQPEKWYPRPTIQPGTLEHYIYNEYGVPSFAMEGGKDDITIAGNNDNVTPEMMKEHINRHHQALLKVINEYLLR
jgi:hypothetical protein